MKSCGKVFIAYKLFFRPLGKIELWLDILVLEIIEYVLLDNLIYSMIVVEIQMVYSLNTIFFKVMVQYLQKLLHRPGIEPGPPARQASILPLNQRCDIYVSGLISEFIFDYFDTFVLDI